MMRKHATDDDTHKSLSPRKRRAKAVASAPAFVWNPRDWERREKYNPDVSLMVSKTNINNLVVKKIMSNSLDSNGDWRPLEIRALLMLPDCNRIVKPLCYLQLDPDVNHGTAIFPHFPLGDLASWRKHYFVEKHLKPVPESYIWRMFVQIAQALAFIQNKIGPAQDKREPLVHRDIKPKNIIVAQNGSTYPSFKLIDFGLATRYSLKKARQESRCGTFEWQPPENPFINRKAADIWSLGAVVHYMAIGRPPLEDVELYSKTRFGMHNEHPSSAKEYTNPQRYYTANAPRKATPINLSKSQQQKRNIVSTTNGESQYNQQYSWELDGWMKQCLRQAPKGRPTAEKLMNEMIPDAYVMLRGFGGQAAMVDLEIEFGR